MVALAAATLSFTVAPARAGSPVDGPGGADRAVLDEQGRQPDGGRGNQSAAEQTDKSVRTLPLGSAGLLELRNMAGDITVTGGPGKEARVEIIRRARGRTEADVTLGLERTRVVVDQQGDRALVAVEPGTDRRPPYFVSVAYVVTAPSGTRLVISSLSSNITVTDIKGEVIAHVTRGDVEVTRAGQVSSVRTIDGDVTLTDLDSDRGLSINALNGDVALERVRSRRVEVDVTSGDVRLRGVTTEAVQITSLQGSVEYTGGLTAGGRYQFQTHSGNIRILLTGPTGANLQAGTFQGNLRLDPSLNLKTAIARRGSVRGTVGDGGATLVAMTFSGNVELARK